MKKMTVKAMAKKANVEPTAMPTTEPELMDFSWPVGEAASSVGLNSVAVLLGTANLAVVVV
jgi:hypothetical protein